MFRASTTVIIPAYNSGKFIADALDSVLRQTAPAAQIIVVNDGSTDDTLERLVPYRSRITVIDQDNRGTAAARNAGLRIASGDFIAFLDADDVWHPRKLEIQLEILRLRPEIQMLGTGIYDYPIITEPTIAGDANVNEVSRDRLLVRNYFTTSSILMRRNLLERVGSFDTTVSHTEDFDYWQRIAEVGVVANLKWPLTGYRKVIGSVSRRPLGIEKGLRRIFQKLDEGNLWGGRRWIRRRAISHMYYSIAHLHADAGRCRLALWKMLQSLAWYPLPYSRSETGVALSRAKRTIILLLGLVGLKRLEPAVSNA